MSKQSLFFSLLFLFNVMLFPHYSEASTAMDLVVVWDKKVYILTDEYVEKVDAEIGEVTKFEMGSYKGSLSENISNVFKEGTKYYSIKGMSVEQSIAVQEDDGRYRKADQKGVQESENKYAIYILIAALLLFFILFIVVLNGLEDKVKSRKKL